MQQEPFRFADILNVLCRHDVDFILIGGAAANLQGSPLATFDVDVVHLRTPENIEKLLRALAELEATYRLPSTTKLSPQLSHLIGKGHQLLRTKFGRLDILGAISPGDLTYEDMLPHCDEMPIDGGGLLRVLKLEKLIETKAAAGRDKDREGVRQLQAVLRERSNQDPTR